MAVNPTTAATAAFENANNLPHNRRWLEHVTRGEINMVPFA
jgi:hypothetical protein